MPNRETFIKKFLFQGNEKGTKVKYIVVDISTIILMHWEKQKLQIKNFAWRCHGLTFLNFKQMAIDVETTKFV